MRYINFLSFARFVLLGCLWAFQMSPAHALDKQSKHSTGTVLLTIQGKSETTGKATVTSFDAAMLDRLPQHSFVTQTPWFKEPVKFSGPLLTDVLQASKVKGSTLIAAALNDYKVDVPFDDAIKYGVILARRMDGRLLSIRDKGPLWLMYPFDSYSEIKNLKHYGRSIWQVQAITVE